MDKLEKEGALIFILYGIEVPSETIKKPSSPLGDSIEKYDEPLGGFVSFELFSGFLEFKSPGGIPSVI